MNYPVCANLTEKYYLCRVFWQKHQLGKVFACDFDIMNKKQK